jgi:hypothetical protein
MGGNSDLVVRAGDLVQATGEITAAPGGPVLFDSGRLSPEPPPSGPGPYAVVVTGVDLARLTGRETNDGILTGSATIRGSWRDRTVAVTETVEPVPPAADPDAWPSDGIPGPPPAGGWEPAGLPDTGDLERYLDQHGERFGGIWVGHPDGPPRPPDYYPTTEVLIVEVVAGDLQDAHDELARRFTGNLCVTSGSVSRATVRADERRLRPLLRDSRNGIKMFGHNHQRRAVIDLLVLEQAIYDRIAAVPNSGTFIIRPAIRPVR